MSELIDNEIKIERAMLISVDCGNFDCESSLDELKELTATAGAEVISTMIQKRPSPDNATCVGSGKLLEIKEFCENNDIDLLIFDLELSPIQLRNIEKETDIRVVDRTMLILDIFAARARTKEGSLQVELAQTKYMLPRLTGKGVELSRLGGGIGTRGPGETKLESDKRHIRRKIDALKEQLLKVENQRNRLRERRKKDGIITVAIVGYTNVGKSTLMNYLTNAGVLAENKLFATLDPTSRGLKLPNGQTVMLIDTVGLVRRLPHNLVEAFKSTLEEAAQADIILNICDASSPEARIHLDVTQNLLEELGCQDKPIVSVLNKFDLLPEDNNIISFDKTVCLSAKTGFGVEKLLTTIEDEVAKINAKVTVELLLPFDKGSIVSRIRNDEVLISEEYTGEGILVKALIDIGFKNELEQYIKN